MVVIIALLLLFFQRVLLLQLLCQWETCCLLVFADTVFDAMNIVMT